MHIKAYWRVVHIGKNGPFEIVSASMCAFEVSLKWPGSTSKKNRSSCPLWGTALNIGLFPLFRLSAVSVRSAYPSQVARLVHVQMRLDICALDVLLAFHPVCCTARSIVFFRVSINFSPRFTGDTALYCISTGKSTNGNTFSFVEVLS